MGLHQILLQTFNKIEGMRVKKIKRRLISMGSYMINRFRLLMTGLYFTKKVSGRGQARPCWKNNY